MVLNVDIDGIHIKKLPHAHDGDCASQLERPIGRLRTSPFGPYTVLRTKHRNGGYAAQIATPRSHGGVYQSD